MAIVCTEKIDSRQLTDTQSAELIYQITGTADEAAALGRKVHRAAVLTG